VPYFATRFKIMYDNKKNIILKLSAINKKNNANYVVRDNNLSLDIIIGISIIISLLGIIILR